VSPLQSGVMLEPPFCARCGGTCNCDDYNDEPEEDVECTACSWTGKESDLEMDEYEEHESSMPLATLCPECGNCTA